MALPEYFKVDGSTTLVLGDVGNATLEDVFFFDGKWMMMTRWVPINNN